MSEFQLKSEDDHIYKFYYPDRCPICHRLIVTPQAGWNGFFDAFVEIVFRCPNPDCRRMFIGFYRHNEGGHYRLIPFEPGPTELPAIIESISPDFVSIYKEAYTAKDAGLDQICGPGFRKSFEFLIKDYAKSKITDDEVKEKRRLYNKKRNARIKEALKLLDK